MDLNYPYCWLQPSNSVVLKHRCKDPVHLSIPGQAFYAGGSERSGQQIIGPGKGRKDIVTEVFKSVKE